MAQAIRVDSRFSTAHDTARILGVSKSRTEALIKIATQYTDQILGRDSKSDPPVDKGHRKSKRKSATSVSRKSSDRDAGAKTSLPKSKKIKARR
jgi:hypothetical protein